MQYGQVDDFYAHLDRAVIHEGASLWWSDEEQIRNEERERRYAEADRAELDLERAVRELDE